MKNQHLILLTAAVVFIAGTAPSVATSTGITAPATTCTTPTQINGFGNGDDYGSSEGDCDNNVGNSYAAKNYANQCEAVAGCEVHVTYGNYQTDYNRYDNDFSSSCTGYYTCSTN